MSRRITTYDEYQQLISEIDRRRRMPIAALG